MSPTGRVGHCVRPSHSSGILSDAMLRPETSSDPTGEMPWCGTGERTAFIRPICLDGHAPVKQEYQPHQSQSYSPSMVVISMLFPNGSFVLKRGRLVMTGTSTMS